MSAYNERAVADAAAKRIEVRLGERSYPVVIGSRLVARTGELCREQGLKGNALVVASESVSALYAAPVLESLQRAGYAAHVAVIPDGEEHKSLGTVDRLYDACVDARLDRGSFIVALGGGVVGDVAGFVAATYMRGIAFVQVPTTLLAQVDASVGGKTAINRPAAKNLVGAFHQPRLVLADLDTLASLPRREYVSGLAEVIKAGLIADAGLFGHLEENWRGLIGLAREPLQHAVVRSVEIKAAVVEADEREEGLRAILNFGHTVGHAIEQAAKYGTYTHGEAVAVGMAIEGRMCVERGMLSEADWRRMIALLRNVGLPVKCRGLNFDDLVGAMFKDKKTAGGKLRFALLDGLGGAAVVPDVAVEEVAEAFEFVAALD